eukprot:TRINITY_DN6676_c0_g2_i2.p1 TRINITY_DN6676_c0_g2~~TRINITY_DN6676_c0_g2_i2.p1  ORF type:complete len:176 (+),score=38.40 TRINITY_DN6676_c0_g2_i2:149-676(+)
MASLLASLFFLPAAVTSAIVSILAILRRRSSSSQRIITHVPNSASQRDGDMRLTAGPSFSRTQQQSEQSVEVTSEMTAPLSAVVAPALDKDIRFVLGQSSMPLSVYESPLMKSFRRFKQRRREGIHEQGSDGYYIVQRTVDTGQQAPHTSDSEVWFLYGRGPVFDPKTEEEDPLA